MKKASYLCACIILALVDASAATTPTNAREIMGKNFIDVTDVEKDFGVKYNPAQMKALASIPFSEATLRESAQTHILFPGYPIAPDELIFRLLREGVQIKDWDNAFFASHGEEKIAAWLTKRNRISFVEFKQLFRSWDKTAGEDGSREKAWFNSNVGVEPRWYLFRKGIFFPATPKSWDELDQNYKNEGNLFVPSPGAKYEEPSFRELLYAMTLYRAAGNGNLYSGTPASTKDRPGRVPGLLFLHFSQDVLEVGDTYMYHGSGFKDRPVLGSAASRKFDQ